MSLLLIKEQSPRLPILTRRQRHPPSLTTTPITFTLLLRSFRHFNTLLRLLIIILKLNTMTFQ